MAERPRPEQGDTEEAATEPVADETVTRTDAVTETPPEPTTSPEARTSATPDETPADSPTPEETPTADSRQPDSPTSDSPVEAPAQPRPGRAPDLFVLLVGLICLAASALTMTGRMPRLPDFDPRWALAAAAVLAGLWMLTASVRRGRRDRTGRAD